MMQGSRNLQHWVVFGKVKRAGNSGFAVYSKRYQEAVETLYKVFQDNRIPWQTVHTGYLDKFCDIYLDISPKWLTEGGVEKRIVLSGMICLMWKLILG